MPVYLKEIILYNFKSFCGKVIIGPFMPFSVMFGPNGTGKSNIMDAISFVMGEKINSLRARKLNDLISCKSDRSLLSKSAYVTVTFEIEGKGKKFTRGIKNSSNVYKIDNEIVTFEFYIHELISLGLNIKSKNFLIFQGSIEAIGIINPKEISIMLDEVSKSAELKSEYEKLRNEMQECDLNYLHIIQKRKLLMAEKKRLILQQEEAEEYYKLKKEYENKKIELKLFQLFHITKNLDNLKFISNDNKSKMYKYEDEKKEEEIILEQKKKKYLEIMDQEIMVENNLTKRNIKKAQLTAQSLAVKEQISHLKEKILFLNKSLTKAHHANEVHCKTMEDLKNELAKIEALKINLTQSISSELESQDSNLELDNTQVKNYYYLKGKVERKCVEHTKNLKLLKYDQENDQNKLDDKKQKKVELEDKKKRLEVLLNETEKRMERLENYIMTTEISLDEKITLKNNLDAELIENNVMMEEMQMKLDNITNKLNAIKVDKFASSKNEQKFKTIRILKDLFPGVYGRLFTLCKPINKKYEIAVTKVLWSFRDAIIVKTEKVAKRCIDYLRQQQISVETFLPLDSLKFQPRDDQFLYNLRNMKDLQNVQLLYDVVEYFPKEISNAILFVTKNTILCETSEDAGRVAYEVYLNCRYPCVAIDGSYYQKSGLFSGGTFDLSTKATIWKDEQIQEVKLQKVTLIENMRKASKCTGKQSELNTINSEILGLTNKLKYSRTDLDNIKKQISNLETDIDNINYQLISIFDDIKSIQNILDKRHENIQNIENQIDNVERTIFSVFCQNINIVNIREYEKGRLRIRGQQKKREMELEDQWNCIRNALDLEMHHNVEDEIKKYEIAIQTTEEQLKIAFEEESAIKDVIDKQNDELQNLNHIYTNLNTEVNNMKNEVALCRRRIGIITKLILETRRVDTIISIKIKENKNESKSILKNCQMENIIIPMSSKNIFNNTESSTNTSSNTVEQSEDNISSKINFSSMSKELKKINDNQYNDIKNKLINNINAIKHKLELIPAPNLKADTNLISVYQKLNIIKNIVNIMRNNANIAKKKFTNIKEERINRFMKYFNYLTFHVDDIYKNLLNNKSAQAFLIPHNPEEPYLNDINYSCMVPGKKFNFLSALSGGEQVFAILALIFAMHRYEAAPFIILDEIDAVLDKINVNNFIHFIRSNLDLMYFIVISFKEKFFINADGLIGVTAKVMFY
ncbi:hypothetical protein M0802_007522 [Mischocyttarus mexicanus]|nr:hypothetical protein M0802_007522 [Mischocyttarus mexicanus]